METEKKLKMLQIFYAGVLADSVLRMGQEGILKKVEEQKRNEQLLSGKMRAQQLGIQKPQDVFEILPEIFGCANWHVENNETGFIAEASNCMLCSMTKKLGAKSPCRIYCLDAMEGMVKGIDDSALYHVKSTLWDSDKCRVEVKENNSDRTNRNQC